MDEIIVFGVLILALVMFVMGTWRYDIVALFALLVLTFAGIVPAAEAFKGFGHPAVVTVAGCLVLIGLFRIRGWSTNRRWYSAFRCSTAASVFVVGRRRSFRLSE